MILCIIERCFRTAFKKNLILSIVTLGEANTDITLLEKLTLILTCWES